MIGSYKYDLLNDVLSMLILGDTGSACIINEKGTIIADQDEKNIAIRSAFMIRILPLKIKRFMTVFYPIRPGPLP